MLTREEVFERIANQIGRHNVSCNCEKCKQMCQRTPCLGTPHDILALIEAGYIDKVCYTEWAAGMALGYTRQPIPMVQLKSTGSKVDGCCICYHDGKSFAMGKSSRELSNEYGIAHTNILTIVRGKHWKHLPTFETVVKHRYGQKSPHSTKQREIARINIQKAIAKRRKISASREYNVIPCACGCGNYIVTPDRRGRERKYIHGHNNNWKNGTN